MDITTIILLFCTLLSILINAIAVDTIRGHQTTEDGETIISASGEFELGFSTPKGLQIGNMVSGAKKKFNRTISWVANRYTPIMNIPWA